MIRDEAKIIVTPTGVSLKEEMRQERCGTLLLMNWHVSNLCLHPLAFLNVYIEVSALSRNHAEELKATYFQS